jgi:hypothetical protein
MQRIQQDEEAAERRESRDAPPPASGFGQLLAGVASGAAAVAERALASMRTPEVASAADDQPAASSARDPYDGPVGGVVGGDELDEHSGGEKRLGAGGYDWEGEDMGEKLSWEAGKGLTPANLPEYVDYKIPGEGDGEVC